VARRENFEAVQPGPKRRRMQKRPPPYFSGEITRQEASDADDRRGVVGFVRDILNAQQSGEIRPSKAGCLMRAGRQHRGDSRSRRLVVSEWALTIDALVKLGGFKGCGGEAAAQYDRGSQPAVPSN